MQVLLAVAVTVKLNVPVVLGGPDSVPPEASVIPGGNRPDVTANVCPVPPVAVMAWL